MKILMVCLGNICRSPLAEGILRKKLLENNLNNIQVDSAGTSNYHIGENPDERSSKNALNHNVDIRDLRARKFTKNDFQQFDKIFVMDSSNYQDVIALTKNKIEIEKVDLLLNLSHPKSNMAVPDPYFGGPEGFENVFQLINNACEVLIHQLKQ